VLCVVAVDDGAADQRRAGRPRAAQVCKPVVLVAKEVDDERGEADAEVLPVTGARGGADVEDGRSTSRLRRSATAKNTASCTSAWASAPISRSIVRYAWVEAAVRDQGEQHQHHVGGEPAAAQHLRSAVSTPSCRSNPSSSRIARSGRASVTLSASPTASRTSSAPVGSPRERLIE
jgi:hypothetical protein